VIVQLHRAGLIYARIGKQVGMRKWLAYGAACS
jgi:hypothetical protein